ncbi:hypothetical protein [Polaribacter sp. M15]|jgi:hypothetical protein
MKLELKNKSDLNFKIILITLVLFEIISCYYAYYTLGEVKQFIFILILSLNIISFLLYHYKLKIISLVVAIIIGLVIIPYQSLLVSKWFELKKESSMLVEYLHSYKRKNGEFPENISDYTFQNQKLTSNFSYYINSNDFRLHYYIGTKGTTHFYYNNVGKWEYYPD